MATICAVASAYPTFSVREIRDVNALLGAGGDLASLNYLPPIGQQPPQNSVSDVCVNVFFVWSIMSS